MQADSRGTIESGFSLTLSLAPKKSAGPGRIEKRAERLCGRIAFIVKGWIVRQDSVHNLLAPEQGSALSVQSEEALPISALVTLLEERDFPVLEAVSRKPSLEDVFVSVTGTGSEQMKKEGRK